ncbi:MAG: PKD domain-containing protein [Thermoplasmata archaeon]|nr:PKD domain-containing protein [Thermoplasmata archaeon]
MQTCSNCGTFYDGYACPRCGMRSAASEPMVQTYRCVGCGGGIGADFRHCPHCGKPVDRLPPQSETIYVPQPLNPDAYMAPGPVSFPVTQAPPKSRSGKVLAVILVVAILIIAAIAASIMFTAGDSSFDSAIEISAGDTVDGTLSEAGVDIFYKVLLEPGDVLEATLEGPSDTDFDLFAYENVRFLDRYIITGSANETSDESLRFVAWEEDYYIIDVFSYEGKGDYSMTVEVVDTVSLDDGDNSIIDATVVTAGDVLTGELNSYYDADDYYRILMSSGQILNVFLEVPVQVNTDFDLYIMDSTGEWLDWSESAYGNEQASAYSMYSGYLFINVWAYDGIGEYQLTVEVQEAAGADSNNDIYSAVAALDGQSITGSLNQYDDPDDFFSIYLAAGQTMTAELTGPAESDFDLYLYDGDGYMADSSESPTSYEIIYFTPFFGGTYYINPYAYSGYGSYTLDIDAGGTSSLFADAGNDRTVGTGWTVDFDGSDSSGAITSYSWDFGDGTYGSGSAAAHTYNLVGNYTVTLTVSDGTNNDSDEAVITVVDSATMPEKFALVIGISDYQDEGDLQFCDEDAESWTSYLESQGYTVHTLIDSQASSAEIMSEITWLEEQEEAGDYVAFAFSGHGYYSDRTRSSYICAWNIEEAEGFISDAQLGEAFAGFESQHMFFFFDSCHSGGMDSVAGEGRYVSQTSGQLEYGLDDYKHEHGMWVYWFLEYTVKARGYTDMVDAYPAAYPLAVAGAAELGNEMHPEEEYSGTSFYL